MFIAHVKQQEGYGCDYTIACGEALWILKAQTKPEAIEELRHRIIGDWLPEYNIYEGGCWHDSKLEKATLFEVSNTEEIPLSQLYAEAEDRTKKAQAEAEEKEEMAEYERLKNKFGE